MDTERKYQLTKLLTDLAKILLDLSKLLSDDASKKGIPQISKLISDLEISILKSLVAIRENPLYSQYLYRGIFEGFGLIRGNLEGFGEVYYTTHKDVAQMVGITNQQVGTIVRKILKLPCKRLKKGYMIVFDEKRMEELKKEYGLAESR
jgi:uncharacterized protein YlbG (UPF0298 family)